MGGVIADLNFWWDWYRRNDCRFKILGGVGMVGMIADLKFLGCVGMEVFGVCGDGRSDSRLKVFGGCGDGRSDCRFTFLGDGGGGVNAYCFFARWR